MIELWELFGAAWTAAVTLAALLAWLGIQGIGRGQPLHGIGVAHTAAAAVAVALVLVPGLGEDNRRVVALASGMAAAVAMALRGGSGAVAWLVLTGAALPAMLLADRAHGAEEVRRLFAGSLLGATWGDSAAAAMLALAAGLLRRWRGVALDLACVDPRACAGVGVDARLWLAVQAALEGAALGLALVAAGSLYATGCLVLPALALARVCPSLATLRWAVPVTAGAVAAAGCAIAHQLDLPTGHVIVAGLGGIGLVALLARRR